MNLKDYIVDVPNWPKDGITFKDITPLLANTNALEFATLSMRGLLGSNNGQPSHIVGIEARGFIFGAHLAKRMNCSFIPLRKKGKLPPPVISKEYELEYGTDTLEIKQGEGKVVIVDDVYATGGTAKAAKELVYEAGYDIVDEIFLINLKFLNQDKVKSVMTYE
ncbi:adenine phosphoribosyltransferase [Candidatus Woesearchaeota archaeon]|nr:adenine phosphoribosyltransferase [Candidatus Woesearchaeota archaeon]